MLTYVFDAELQPEGLKADCACVEAAQASQICAREGPWDIPVSQNGRAQTFRLAIAVAATFYFLEIPRVTVDRYAG